MEDTHSRIKGHRKCSCTWVKDLVVYLALVCWAIVLVLLPTLRFLAALAFAEANIFL